MSKRIICAILVMLFATIAGYCKTLHIGPGTQYSGIIDYTYRGSEIIFRRSNGSKIIVGIYTTWWLED